MNFSNNDQRRVLLIDRDSMKQKLRAAALRNCEVEVHTASAAAGRLWRAHAYDLVLIAAEENSEEAAALCSELKKSKPKQRIALLVGAPQYIREIGRQRTENQPSPRLAIGTTQTQATQWHVMMERLLAAG